MPGKRLRIAIVGTGIAGLTAARAEGMRFHLPFGDGTGTGYSDETGGERAPGTLANSAMRNTPRVYA